MVRHNQIFRISPIYHEVRMMMNCVSRPSDTFAKDHRLCCNVGPSAGRQPARNDLIVRKIINVGSLTNIDKKNSLNKIQCLTRTFFCRTYGK